MAQVRPEYGFNVDRTAKAVRYTVAGEGIGFLMTFAVMLIALFLGAVPAGIFGSYVPLIIVLLAAYGLLRWMSSRMKRPVTITIGPASVVVEKGDQARTFERADIRNLSLQNEAQRRTVSSADFQNGHFVVVGSGFAGTAAAGFAVMSAGLNRAAHQTGHAVGRAAAAEMANRSWSIKILYGSKYIYLAKNLKQAKAESLYADLCRSFQEIG